MYIAALLACTTAGVAYGCTVVRYTLCAAYLCLIGCAMHQLHCGQVCSMLVVQDQLIRGPYIREQ